MASNSNHKDSPIVANTLRRLARFGSLIVALLVGTFSLLSGSEAYGGGLKGVVENSPNALPWLILMGLALLLWKNELLAGTLLLALGLWLVYFLNFSGPNFWWTTFFVSLSLPLLGICAMLSWKLRQN